MRYDARFFVVSHLSGTRTFEDMVAIFQKGLDNSKVRPRAVFVDGSHVYQSAFNRVFYSRYNVDRVELFRELESEQGKQTTSSRDYMRH